MSMNRKNKMGKRGHRRSFPMSSENITCPQCGKSITKKKSLMKTMQTGKVFNQTKEMSRRGCEGSQERKRMPSFCVSGVVRICREGCK